MKGISKKVPALLLSVLLVLTPTLAFAASSDDLVGNDLSAEGVLEAVDEGVLPDTDASEGAALDAAPDDAADESVSSDVPDPSASDPLAGEVPEGDSLEADPPTDDSALAPLALPAPLTTSSTYLIRPLASKNAVLDVLAGSKTKGANITV
ncbi:MAG: hypothetical protein LBS98_04430, partial [Coriobacteriales bacterium]|nr:hypothetical protein [Coriobacteriales bacterium]